MPFSMYTRPLSTTIDSLANTHYSFSADLQLLISTPSKISELLHSMQSRISDVEAWAMASMLNINDNKTELMLVTSKQLSISIIQLVQSLLIMLKFLSNSLRGI